MTGFRRRAAAHLLKVEGEQALNVLAAEVAGMEGPTSVILAIAELASLGDWLRPAIPDRLRVTL